MSKIDIMIQEIQNFTPLSETIMRVLLDSWYSTKEIWKVVLARGFLITTGLKCNRSLRVSCQNDPKGWNRHTC